MRQSSIQTSAHTGSLAVTPVVSAAGHTPEALWFGVDFPDLAVMVHDPADRPMVVVVVEHRLGKQVHDMCPNARGAGVRSGMSVSAALALCPELEVRLRDKDAEQVQLRRFAQYCQCFTPTISLDPPTTVLLEVRASLTLFGGMSGLRRALQGALDAKLNRHGQNRPGRDFCLAAAPTPMAASLLARAGRHRFISEPAALRSMLADLPLSSLALAAPTDQALRRVGVVTLRDLWRLPRDGLAHRYGQDLSRMLDKVLGVAPDPRPGIIATPGFHGHREVPELHKREQLLAVVESLIKDLIRFLHEHDVATSRLHWFFEHQFHPVTECSLGTRTPTRDPDRLLQLCSERLHRMALPAPVVGVRLVVDQCQPFIADNRELFCSSTTSKWLHHREQIEARLGKSRLSGVGSMDDHRPERAWSRRLNPAATSLAEHRRRPFWLLPQPRLLGHERSALSIVDGPERIESGWWDGEDCCRDYYRARKHNGSELWIFRDLKHGEWYVHGLFG